MAFLGFELRHSWDGMVLSALCIACFGCQGDNPSNKNAVGTSGNVWMVTVAPDQSLTTDEYIKLGVPAIERMWNSHDLGAAVTALKSLAETPEILPRYQSKQSGEVFNKLLDKQFSARLLNQNIPINFRMSEDVFGMDHVKNLLGVYMLATKADRVFDAELVSVQAYFLNYMADTMPVVNEFAKTLSPEDPTYKVRMNELAKLRSSLAGMATSALQAFAEKHAYRTTELVRLANELKPILPRLVPELTPQSKTEVPVRLRQLIKDETDPELKKALSVLLDRLEKV